MMGFIFFQPTNKRKCKAPSRSKSLFSNFFRLIIGSIFVWMIACDDEPIPEPYNALPDLAPLCENGCDLSPPVEVDMMIPRRPQCDDDIDNDGDGLVDGFDRGCESLLDDDERDPDQIPACSDGIDNDGDNLVDYPHDPQCGSPDDLYEARPEEELPECADGVDNDGDGNIDFPVDRGCGSETDRSEGDDPTTIPQCSDERDNDADDLVDISDPGCEDDDDPLELDGPIGERPRCSDGIDNDGDGFVDFPRDPGCTRASDDEEITLPFPTECYDDIDNDGDGLVDFPLDPGCAGVGDEDETDRENPPGCSDLIDNDNDGSIDYPDDTGCLSRGDDSERGECGDVFESGSLRDGVIVRGTLTQAFAATSGSCGGGGGKEIAFRYTVRRRLQALVITTELPDNHVESALYVRRRCGDPDTEILCKAEAFDGFPAQTIRVEEPELGDYFIFLDALSNATGDFAIKLDEEEIPECRNEVDDDFNGLVDFPYDSGCDDPYDITERPLPEPPACSDELDNDGDGLTDYPNDLGCLFAGDQDEDDICGQGVPIDFFPTGAKEVIGNSSQGGSNRFEGSCGGANIREQVFLYNQPFSARVTFSVDHPETEQPTLLHVRAGDCFREGEGMDWFNERGCALGFGEEQKATLVIESMAPGTYFVFVDHPDGEGGPFKLTVDFQRLPASCRNGLDDDRDGLIDGEDLGCDSIDDDDETDDRIFGEDELRPACFDGIDNDGDELIDFPLDPGCALKLDDDEANPERLPACANGRDDDLDELIDLEDSGCYAASDEVEDDVRPTPQCSNRYDDDGDGLIDYPQDPHCQSKGDLSEFDDGRVSECADQIDNDEDGLSDFPQDPSCTSAGDLIEEMLTILPECSNGEDDDGDELIDFPDELGCESASDDSEQDPEELPQCSNGIDDDRDRSVDWPNDPECIGAGDQSERR